MLDLAVFALIVLLVAIVLAYVVDYLLGLMGADPGLRNVARVVIGVVALIAIITRLL